MRSIKKSLVSNPLKCQDEQSNYADFDLSPFPFETGHLNPVSKLFSLTSVCPLSIGHF